MKRLARAAALLAAALSACGAAAAEAPDADARLAYYRARIGEHPKVYALHLGLAQACLDKARATHDPAFLADARAASQIARELQESLEGYKMEARIALFRHRFEEALDWVAKAEPLLSADVADGAVAALKVEALLGMKRVREAQALLPPAGSPTDDFHVAAARGHVFAALGEGNAAADAFAEAARLAEAAGATALAGWALAAAAGVFIDAGAPEEARPYLERAGAYDGASRFRRIHLAELAAAEGRDGEALAMFEALVSEADDPELRRRAFRLARRLGDAAAAQEHFAAAEGLLVRALSAGEMFTMDELVRLYEDSGLSPQAARVRAESGRARADPQGQ
jgi:hypothetical protein